MLLDQTRVSNLNQKKDVSIDACVPFIQHIMTDLAMNSNKMTAYKLQISVGRYLFNKVTSQYAPVL